MGGPSAACEIRRKIGCVATPIAGDSGSRRELPVRISSRTSPEAPPASGRLKNAPNEARGLASRQPGLSRRSSEGHLFRRRRSTSYRHTFSNTIWLFYSTHMGSAHRDSHRCVPLLPHNCLCATDGCARSEKDQQGFVRARPLHVAQPHRHPHRSRTRPGHCGPPLTTAGVRQRGCSPSDGVSHDKGGRTRNHE